MTISLAQHVAAGFLLLACVPLPAAADIVGRASVIDGDTIEIHGKRIRLHGIDAPESKQRCQDHAGDAYPCGSVSAHALAGYLANSSPTRCEPHGKDKYGREIATCFRADGEDVAGFLVRHGLALDWPRYSDGAYAADQATARAGRLGMWQGEFDKPWDWREGKHPVAASLGASNVSPSATPSQQACNIKGNINDRGDRIYHVPGSYWYDRTVINPLRGERWFCSADEARRAGWRAPRG